jgi:hypothetical protein
VEVAPAHALVASDGEDLTLRYQLHARDPARQARGYVCRSIGSGQRPRLPVVAFTERPRVSVPGASLTGKRLILSLSSALIVLVDPGAARLLAVRLISCIMNPCKNGGDESGCNGQANEQSLFMEVVSF